MDQAVDTHGRLVVKFGSAYSEESDEIVIIPESEGEINIAWFLYEFIALAIPIKHVHPPGECNRVVASKFRNCLLYTSWTMYLEIPKQAMGFADHESLAGQRVRANFYKCGDETPEPHFLSWNPIDTPKPDFHLPEFFGLLELE